jgi:hypothetical protein
MFFKLGAELYGTSAALRMDDFWPGIADSDAANGHNS